MFSGQRKGNERENERKTKGNTWSEQEDALFGPMSTETAASPAYCQPCSPSTDSYDYDRKMPAKVKSSPSRRNKSANATIQEQGRKLSSLAGNASFKLSSFISKAKDEVARVKDDVMQQQQQHQRQRTSNDNGGSRNGQSRSEAIPSIKKSKGKPTHTNSVSPLPSFSTQVPQPPSNAQNNRQNISRMVQNVLVSQVPLKCLHCNSIPLMFKSHPFFGPTQRICSTHPDNIVVRCVSCFRYQPKTNRFAAIGTSDARICPACARTAILDDNAARALYHNVLQFMESQKLDMFQGKMRNIPVQLVGEDSMNRQSSSIGCDANEQKRGLTIWSEHHVGLPNIVGVARHTSNVLRRFVEGGARNKNESNRNHTEDNNDGIRRNHWAGVRHVAVKKILCLKGLPRNLMASILAHEATHAWLAINPIRRDGVIGEQTSFGQVRKIDQTVEEGLCQLVSHLYLQQLMANDERESFMDNFKGGGPSDVKLNQYYKWSIENHSSPIYGGGFKKAVTAYSEIVQSGGGLKELFQYVSIHRDFPPV